MTTPDSTPPALDRIAPTAITFAPASPGALRCSACGALVDDDPAHVGTDDHTTFHKILGEVVDGVAVRLAQVEEALADADARIALDGDAARAVRSLAPPAWGAATDELISRFLGDLAVGAVRIILDGPRDTVTPAADALCRLLALVPDSPIVRDAAVPVAEQRAYTIDLNDLRNQVNRYTAALAGRPTTPTTPAAVDAGPPELDVEPSEGSGVVRVRLEGDPDDVELAVELAEATGFPLNDVSDPYDNRRGPCGHVRRYGVVNLTRGRPVPRDQHAPDAMLDDQ